MPVYYISVEISVLWILFCRNWNWNCLLCSYFNFCNIFCSLFIDSILLTTSPRAQQSVISSYSRKKYAWKMELQNFLNFHHYSTMPDLNFQLLHHPKSIPDIISPIFDENIRCNEVHYQFIVKFSGKSCNWTHSQGLIPSH